MRQLRIGLAQINCTVGDLAGNVAKIKEYASRAAEAGVDLLAFPELSICGYPPEDLLLKPGFVQDCLAALDELIRYSRDPGYPLLAVGCVNRQTDVYNGAALIDRGRLVDVYHKVFLPNYGVFDEQRYFKSGRRGLVLDLNGVKLGISICEDIWYPQGPPLAEIFGAGAEVIININASPYHLNKGELRAEMLSLRAKEGLAAIAYVNLVGGQDELVFDGQSLVFDHEGEQIAAGRQFTEDLVVADIDGDLISAARQAAPGWRRRRDERAKNSFKVDFIEVEPRAISLEKPKIEAEKIKPLPGEAEVAAALKLGVGDYVKKNRFSHVVIGLSGGIDSALTAALAAAALGPDNVTAVSMPSRFTSAASIEDAEATAKNLGVELVTIPIDPILAGYHSALAAVFAGRPADVTEENLQARIRGNLLMALSNKFGWLLLSTGNKSEMSVGYCTLYGDMSGGFALLKDVPKTMVYRLAGYLNEREGRELIPDRVLTKQPSAELRPDQKDTDSLPPYEVLDPILEAYIEENRSFSEMVDAGFDPDITAAVIKMVDRSEYKRRQAPPGVKITTRAFGKDWRVPITNWYGRK